MEGFLIAGLLPEPFDGDFIDGFEELLGVDRTAGFDDELGVDRTAGFDGLLDGVLTVGFDVSRRYSGVLGFS